MKKFWKPKRRLTHYIGYSAGVGVRVSENVFNQTVSLVKSVPDRARMKGRELSRSFNEGKGKEGIMDKPNPVDNFVRALRREVVIEICDYLNSKARYVSAPGLNHERNTYWESAGWEAAVEEITAHFITSEPSADKSEPQGTDPPAG